ncbi:putative 26S proteasome regulatory subunit Rpn7/COP9 signalosome complex subunit 1 [Rosa chinensis]|uniref:Putative 26S proteasome regulatory subunit Rpn7/COP9 signalosome complex subunit 1 n=1 Tax=Rosa chinensis TaxID=74649 RepID=A0A2P6P553_ROSCH|nr:putative 26S proteasome regulatory subunit Rpn7/COP9 signalosome complex subunit 1 [Rosa chinensis]
MCFGYTLSKRSFVIPLNSIDNIADAEENLGEIEVREAHLAKSLFFIDPCDWERKNRLKVYKGLYCMSTGKFKKAADLCSWIPFLPSPLTKYFPMTSFYTVLTSIIFLDRLSFSGLAEQIKLDRYLHPHIKYYMREIRTVVYSQFLESYKCDY